MGGGGGASMQWRHVGGPPPRPLLLPEVKVAYKLVGTARVGGWAF